jgi:hypothetical protein
MRDNDSLILESLYEIVFENSGMDAKYAELERKSKDGDKEAESEAQRMVEVAANRTGYRVKAYHGTTSKQFSKFLFSKRPSPYKWRGNEDKQIESQGFATPIGMEVIIEPFGDGKYKVTTINQNTAHKKIFNSIQDAKDAIELGRGDINITNRTAFFFAKNKLYSELFSYHSGSGHTSKETGSSMIIPVLLKTDKIFDFRDKKTREWLQNWISSNIEYIKKESRYWEFDFSKNAAIQNLKNGNWGVFEALPKLTEDLKSQGYNGYTTLEGGNLLWKDQEWSDFFKRAEKHRGRGGLDASLNYAIFNSNDIKAAYPFTYDDNGELIPLSQRFDSSKDDIRY